MFTATNFIHSNRTNYTLLPTRGRHREQLAVQQSLGRIASIDKYAPHTTRGSAATSSAGVPRRAEPAARGLPTTPPAMAPGGPRIQAWLPIRVRARATRRMKTHTMTKA